jgi:hypothetical protein
MKLDLLFVSLILGIGLALIIEKMFGLSQPVTTSGTTNLTSIVKTGDPVRDFMDAHYPG